MQVAPVAGLGGRAPAEPLDSDWAGAYRAVVHGLEFTRWILARALSRPLVLGALLLLIGVGELLERLVDLGVATRMADFPLLLGASAFLAGICGTGFAATLAARLEPELAGLRPLGRTWTELVPLWTLGYLAQVLVLGSAFLRAPILRGTGLLGLVGEQGGWGASSAPWAALLLSGALAQLHLAGIALVLLRTRLPAGAMTLTLALLTLPLAGLLRESGLGSPMLRPLVDAGAHLLDAPIAVSTLAENPVRWLAPLALVGFAVSLTSPYPRRILAIRGDRTGGRADG
jgi:hypothetical protein